MPQTRIACRPASYAPFGHLAFEHLAGLGIRFVEIPIAAARQSVADLAHFNMQVSSFQGECDLARNNIADQLEPQMEVCNLFGVDLLFLSVHAGHTPLSTAYERLRTAGDLAARCGVALTLETHPDLITNAQIAAQTMAGVDHPQVRVNFDTANVYFYNHGVNAVEELRLVLPFVASVHLKDTDGGFHSWHFPALGRGVVDFRGIFDLLDEAGFMGPCTLEIEGIEGEDKTERLVCDRIAESVGYLRGLGRLQTRSLHPQNST
jgi:sugar phosphate isomerase/epimerase